MESMEETTDDLEELEDYEEDDEEGEGGLALLRPRRQEPVFKPDLSPYPLAWSVDPGSGRVTLLARVGDSVAVQSPDPRRSTYLGILDRILTGDEPGCSGVQGNLTFYVPSMGHMAMSNYLTAQREGWVLALYPGRRIPGEPRKKNPRKAKRKSPL
jgi:hypothetical protein